MSVTLLRAYGGYASGAIVTLPDSTESALITQGYATAQETTSFPSTAYGQSGLMSQNGTITTASVAGQSAPTYPQGPRILPNVPILAFASLGTSGVHVAGTVYFSEIFVPHWNQWTGIGVLNGATVGTDNMLIALYGSNGALITNSAVAGTLSAGANAMQNRAFLNSVVLAPGRYFIAMQANGTTCTTRKQAAANGSNTMTGSVAGTFGTLPATITVPTTFTDVVGPIGWLYT